MFAPVLQSFLLLPEKKHRTTETGAANHSNVMRAKFWKKPKPLHALNQQREPTRQTRFIPGMPL